MQYFNGLEADDIIAKALMLLLEELFTRKHLYQSLELEPFLKKALLLREPPMAESALETALRELEVCAFGKVWEFRNRAMPMPARSSVGPPPFFTKVPDIKADCRSASCRRREPHNFETETPDVLAYVPPVRLGQGMTAPLQAWGFTYVCQSCKGERLVFLVRRTSNKLQLCGRSPIEYVDVPHQVPKRVAKYFSDATVAFQSGQVLAGTFLLRVLVEQFVAVYFPQRDPAKRIDQLLEDYKASLPPEMRDRFPSLTKVYEELSLAIHNAAESEEPFRKARGEIVKHFDARRVFELGDKLAEPSKN